MRGSGKEYYVGVQEFYSTYTIMQEQRIPHLMVDTLNCNGERYQLVASSNTSHYCEK